MSPFHEFYANPETALGVVADRYYGVFNGEDPIENYWSLRQQAVLYDVPEKPWQIEGPDALPFRDKIFAWRIDNLSEGRGRYAIACTDDGGGPAAWFGLREHGIDGDSLSRGRHPRQYHRL
jgi:glycine cleavage system aminomethyltransferase T